MLGLYILRLLFIFFMVATVTSLFSIATGISSPGTFIRFILNTPALGICFYFKVDSIALVSPRRSFRNVCNNTMFALSSIMTKLFYQKERVYASVYGSVMFTNIRKGIRHYRYTNASIISEYK